MAGLAHTMINFYHIIKNTWVGSGLMRARRVSPTRDFMGAGCRFSNGFQIRVGHGLVVQKVCSTSGPIRFTRIRPVYQGQTKLNWMSQNQLERIRIDFNLKPVRLIILYIIVQRGKRFSHLNKFNLQLISHYHFPCTSTCTHTNIALIDQDHPACGALL